MEEKKFRKLKNRLLITIIVLIIITAILALKLILSEKIPKDIEYIEKCEVVDLLIPLGIEQSTFLEKISNDNYSYLVYEDMIQILEENIIKNKLEKSDKYSQWLKKYKKNNKKYPVAKDELLQLSKELYEIINVDIEQKNIFVLADKSMYKELEENQIYTAEGVYFWGVSKEVSMYLYKNINVFLYKDKIIYLEEESNSTYRIDNIYIVNNENGVINCFWNERSISFKMAQTKDNFEGKIADVIFENGLVSTVYIKDDRITGKVLSIGEDYIEIEEYGKVPFVSDMKVYKEYGKFEEKARKDIPIGYDIAEFVVADEKIVATFIMKDLVVENIRVLIKTTNYASNYHESVELTSDDDYIVKYGDVTEEYCAGDVVTFTKDDSRFCEGRIYIRPKTLSGKLQLNSIDRGCGKPTYRGKMEIVLNDEGLSIVNEVGLEEYLYAVVPSEMPQSYELEALKTQAICARSYAYNHILENYSSELGAHVDDSVSYQVYANCSEETSTTTAVKETYGEVVKKGDKVIDTYYYSTSCGHSGDGIDWIDTEEGVEYLQGKSLGEDEIKYDLSDEAQFYEFLVESNYQGYECTLPWYRWNVTIDISSLSATLNNRLGKISKNNPKDILVKKKDGEYEEKYIDYVGKIKEIIPIHRCTSGMLTCVEIVGAKASIKVSGEYNIRYLLAPLKQEIFRDNSESVQGFDLLPSSYMVFKANYKNKKIESYTFIGGGYGHGIGMSQNGANALASLGMNSTDIIKYFYTDVSVENIYE